ncbi:aspartate/glutamate racemase family protein, partial [Thermomicrobium sp.]|uniref:aspartate/glutamate racemase family protein n=1 Tax=Thermomicrobium sp. TaxID=1969469 RepID=UPI00338F5655
MSGIVAARRAAVTRRSIIGILGGMGPLATVDLYRKIIEATPAERDQDHLHVIIDADPSIPDRTA